MRLVRQARENIYFAEKDRKMIEQLRTRLRKAERLGAKDLRRVARRRGKHATPSKIHLAPRATPRLAPANVRQNCAKTYLVPVDFSTGSKIALRHAVRIARENSRKLLLLHVINWKAVSAPEFPRNHIDIFKTKARDRLAKLARDVRLEAEEYRSILIWGNNIARAIADHAKETQTSMIIMGSHGRTGLKRLVLGSVAERTIRYAECPVLIVKK